MAASAAASAAAAAAVAAKSEVVIPFTLEYVRAQLRRLREEQDSSSCLAKIVTCTWLAGTPGHEAQDKDAWESAKEYRAWHQEIEHWERVEAEILARPDVETALRYSPTSDKKWDVVDGWYAPNVTSIEAANLTVDHDEFASLLEAKAPTLRRLVLHESGVTALSGATFRNMTMLEALSLTQNHELSRLPDELFESTSLRTFVVGGGEQMGNSPLLDVSPRVWTMTNLTGLALRNEIAVLPSAVGNLVHLRQLAVEGVENIPPELGQLLQLRRLHLVTKASSVPDTFNNLSKLEAFYLRGCNMRTLPYTLEGMQSLEELTLECCGFEDTLPYSVGDLASLKKLVIKNCRKLRDLPPSVGDLESLATLDLNHTRLNTLPSTLARCKELVVYTNATPFLKDQELTAAFYSRHGGNRFDMHVLERVRDLLRKRDRSPLIKRARDDSAAAPPTNDDDEDDTDADAKPRAVKIARV